MEKLFTVEFWQAQSAVVMAAPWVIVPLLLFVGFLGWKVKAVLDDGEMRGLKAETNAAKGQLELAQNKQQVVTDQTTKLQAQIDKLTDEVSQIRASLPQVTAPQLDKVANTAVEVGTTIHVLNEANTALGTTLSSKVLKDIFSDWRKVVEERDRRLHATDKTEK